MPRSEKKNRVINGNQMLFIFVPVMLWFFCVSIKSWVVTEDAVGGVWAVHLKHTNDESKESETLRWEDYCIRTKEGPHNGSFLVLQQEENEELFVESKTYGLTQDQSEQICYSKIFVYTRIYLLISIIFSVTAFLIGFWIMSKPQHPRVAVLKFFPVGCTLLSGISGCIVMCLWLKNIDEYDSHCFNMNVAAWVLCTLASVSMFTTSVVPGLCDVNSKQSRGKQLGLPSEATIHTAKTDEIFNIYSPRQNSYRRDFS